jgi:hypothetical protein
MVNISDFYGNWIIESRSSIDFESTFIIINENILYIFLGPINYVRTNYFYDLKYTYKGTPPYFIVNYKLIGNDLYIDNGIFICSFRNGNKNKLQFTSYNGFGFPTIKKPYQTAVYFKRLSSIPKTLTQSLEFPNAINWNNPKLLLNYWLSDFKCSYNNIPHLGTNYYSNKKFNEIAKIFLENKNGILRKACIQWIYKSNNNPISYRPIILLGDFEQTAPTISYYGTVLFISKYNKITSSNRVTISGYKGEWAVINGDWNIEPSIYNNSITYPNDRAFTCSNRRYIIIPFDSRKLPNYNPLKHGYGEVKSFHKSINEKSSYRDMVVALDELILSTGFATHTRGFYIAIIKDVNKPPVIPETYKEIQDLLNTNPSYVVNILFISRNRPQCNGDMYINPTSYQISSFDINNPFNINTTLNYSIVAENYLLKSSVKTIYYKVEPDGNIVFQVGDIGVIPSGYIPLNSNVFFGFVNQSRTNKNRVGYIYFSDFQFYSNSFGTTENSNYYVYLLIGTIMNYLITTYKIQDIIFDIRGNGGGSSTLCYTVACSVGGKRNYLNQTNDPNGNPCNPDLYRADYPYIDPAEMEKVIPNSVLHGTPKRTANVIIIDDINAASYGDVFPSQFTGDNGDGELGNYTKAYIVGNIDGRLSGGVNTFRFTPVKTPEEAAIYYKSDVYGEYSIPPFSFQNDFSISLLYANTKKSISYFQKETNPSVLIPHDFSVVYSDMGYLPPTICYLNNVQPNKDDPSTWQDSYFENAIRIIRKFKPAIPKAYKYIQIGNDKPISFWQKVYQYEKPREHKIIDQYPIGGAKYPIGGAKYPIGGAKYPIGGAKYPIGGAKYPIGKNDQTEIEDIAINSNVTPPTKCIKCYNVVIKDSDTSTKSLTLSKYFSPKIYMDNLTALDIELRKFSFIHPKENLLKQTKDIDNDSILSKILKNKKNL